MSKHSLILALVLAFTHLSDLRGIDLSLVDESRLERVGEPVTCGVPLARGYCHSPEELVLKIGGQPVPVEIREVSRWPDGSLRWVHLDFQADVPKGRMINASLEKGDRTPVDSKLEVEETKHAISVSTGRLKVEILRRRFNVFNRVKVPGQDGQYYKTLVMPHRRGLVAWAGKREFLSANDTLSVLEIESRGTMRVVLRAEGNLQDTTGVTLFRYVCRLYFYNDSPVVRLAFTIENRDPVIEHKVALQGLHVEIPTRIRGAGGAYDIGRPGGNVQGIFPNRFSTAWVLVNSSSQSTFGTESFFEYAGSPKEEKSPELGWISLGSVKGMVGVGLRYFWQMYPSYLEVNAGGLINAGLFPYRLNSSIDIYSGLARTHYLRFAFLGVGDPELMRSLVGSCQQPLLAIAETSYYSQETRAFGNIFNRDPRNYPKEYRRIAEYVDGELDAGFAYMNRMIDKRTVNGVTRDSYGFLNWGDGLHYAWVPGSDDKRNLCWNHHYYDLPHMCCIEFARAGCLCWLDFFLPQAHHLMDVHVVHFDPDNELNGRNRYCPPTDHVRMDPRPREDFRTARVYVSSSTNHHKTQGLFDCYLLTGDERSLEVALKALEFAASFGAYGDFRQPRGAAHQVLTLVCGYRITGDKRYLDIANSTFELWWKHFQETETKFTLGYFQVGLLLEAFIDLYEETGDRRIVEFTRQAVDWMLENRPNDKYPNMSLALGFLSARLKDTSYIEPLKEYLLRFKGVQQNAFKGFALNGRNLARALYYLSNEVMGND